MKWRKGDDIERNFISSPIKVHTENGFYYALGTYYCEDGDWWNVLNNEIIPSERIEYLDESKNGSFESAIQLIKDIRHGNVYNDIPSVCEKWLKDNNHE